MQPPPQPTGDILGGLFLALGLLMVLWRPGPNCWIGVRLPWTLADREIWDKSWRLAAMFCLGMGVGALVSWKIFIISLIHLAVLGILYPMYQYRRKYGTLKYWRGEGRLDFRPQARCPACGHLVKLNSSSALPDFLCEQCGFRGRDR
jgi:hypothetical protein